MQGICILDVDDDCRRDGAFSQGSGASQACWNDDTLPDCWHLCSAHAELLKECNFEAIGRRARRAPPVQPAVPCFEQETWLQLCDRWMKQMSSAPFCNCVTSPNLPLASQVKHLYRHLSSSAPQSVYSVSLLFVHRLFEFSLVVTVQHVLLSLQVHAQPVRQPIMRCQKHIILSVISL